MLCCVTLKQKFASDFGDLLRPLWVITLRKQLGKLLNWKASKQTVAYIKENGNVHIFLNT